MMDIEGLINNRDQSGLHISQNPFALPTSTTNEPTTSSTSDRDHHLSFGFSTISPTLNENSDFNDTFHARKRGSHDVDDSTMGGGVIGGGGGARQSPPGRKKSQPKDAGRMSSAKDYPRR